MSERTTAEKSTAVPDLLAKMHHSGVLRADEYQALLHALRLDLLDAIWEAREYGYQDGLTDHGRHDCCKRGAL